jgi:Domain of unknown function (DUF5916)/Carbohydrate family 9 binding domain-like
LKYGLILFAFFALPVALLGQKKNAAYQLPIRKANTPIQVDGSPEESAWKEAAVAGNFFMVLPMDTSKANVHTEVRMTYDKDNLYLLAICFHDPNQKYMVESLKRDFNFGKNDNFLLFMDPFDDRTNGFSFGASAAGAQWDGTMYEGSKVDLSWDNKWSSVVKNYPDRWILEAAIPFKSIRYKKGITEWGINFSRLDITKAEKSSWAPVPRQFPTASLAYTGTLVWDKAPPEVGANISVIPYILGNGSKNFETKKPTKYRNDIGLDAKIAVSTALNLDLTVNPDFSQVEVDRQVTNLERFELFFPERRQFFLENGDHFSNFGYASIRPFFSRRIGLNAPINAGARLSGKINKDWRLGVMNIQTGKVDSIGLPAQNFSVLALQRRVFARSNIGFLFINKQSVNYNGADSGKQAFSLYNRNFGLEYNLASANNAWTGKLMALKSFSPGASGSNWVHAGNLQWASRKWIVAWQHEWVQKNYIAEAGYVPRKNYVKVNPFVSHLFFPSRGKVVSHGPRLISNYYFTPSFKKTDHENILIYLVNFRNQSIFDVWVGESFIQLLQPFDPTNSGKDTLSTGSRHRWKAAGVEFFSKPQKRFTYSFSTRFGGYYARGNRSNINVDLGYRFQPYVNIALSTNYNHIDLPEPWKQTSFWLVGPRVDITMTNKLFFTTFFQYNNQQKNMNLNTRFQWRYRPASDLFIVYTDNYFPAPLSVRNRAIVLKCTYWWNW